MLWFIESKLRPSAIRPTRRWLAVSPAAALRVIVLGGAAFFALATAAQACPACAPGNGKSRSIYVASTVGLSLLPIVLIGFGAWFLRRSGAGPGKTKTPGRNPGVSTEEQSSRVDL